MGLKPGATWSFQSFVGRVQGRANTRPGGNGDPGDITWSYWTVTQDAAHEAKSVVRIVGLPAGDPCALDRLVMTPLQKRAFRWRDTGGGELDVEPMAAEETPAGTDEHRS